MRVGSLVAGLLAAACWLLLQPAQRAGRRFPVPLRTDDRPTSPAPDPFRSTGISDPALMLDLVAAMLDAGQPLLPALGVLAEVVDSDTARSLRRVQAALELGAPWAVAWELASPGGHASGGADDLPPAQRPLRRDSLQAKAPADHLREALTFVAATGAPSAAVLLAEAAQLRRRRSREAERRAAALGVRLVVPLGLCALPAFLVLTVVPLLLSLLPSFP